ncbi:hypothetical protein KFL_007650030 [Klebsormidium nitens]|uniref:MAGE domain-containing protein n=1 Tax=Klebsormidium nitens TaxID=105231 RepID=A0A1Y1IKV6_KLENI|nr:hypothetical protein KFL_007650030 [Klebsormidium nitens]|eukprot:GAQ91323.1 hypothetical protein KFL_007650030 [Klebsormidium nitens]
MPRGKRAAVEEEEEEAQPRATQKQSRRGKRAQRDEEEEEPVRGQQEEGQEEGATGREGGEETAEELTQRYTSAAEAVELEPFGLTSEEGDKLVADVMRLMLFKNGSNPGVPVKREDILAVVNKTYKDRRGTAGHIITLAQAKFVSIFGMEMKEELRVARKKGPRRADPGEGTGAKTYLLKSLLPLDLRQRFVEPPKTASLKGFGAVILCLIHLAQDSLSEAALHNYLSKLGVKAEDDAHPALGNVDAAIQALIKQRLIEKVAVPGDEPETHYVMGDVGQSQVGTEKLQDMIKQIMGDAEPDLADGADD